MATIKYKDFPRIGQGFSIHTQTIPPAGLIPVLRAARQGQINLFRYSKDGGQSFTDWLTLTKEVFDDLGRFTDSFDLIVDYVVKPFSEPKVKELINPFDEPLSTTIYDKTIFKTFFDSNDPQVLMWAVNVLEKLFEPGIVPLYVSRSNEDDYNTFFFTITHYFAFIVIYARQFRKLEKSDLLMKEFIEGWGLVYENIDTLEQRQYLFTNWIQEFHKRGTYQIVDTGGVIEGELRRLVGYTKPNEFLFGVLVPQDVGWCLGWSSPTWYGTETVNAVSKGWDFGPDYADESASNLISFAEDHIQLEKTGDTVDNQIFTEYPWRLYTGEDVSPEFSESYAVGVGPLKDYPILGNVQRKFIDNLHVFQPSGSGRVGISTEADLDKAFEVYSGLDYEITVWVKALSLGDQNIEYGVNCYDANFQLINQVRITDFRETNSFFTGDRYQSPCKVPGIFYKLKGIIYNIIEDKDESLYLNFENGRPLRFIGDVRYMAPYIVQNRDRPVADIHIAGVVLKPLDLPFSQGYLGQKNVIAMYSQINSARTKKDIEEFVRRYLVSYKNVVSYTWLDWVERTSYFLTFYITREADNSPVSGAEISLSNGFIGITDINGYLRFEVKMDVKVYYTVLARGVSVEGDITMSKDQTINLVMKLPMEVDIEIIEPGWGTAAIEGSRMPNTEITLTATPATGYVFIKWVMVTDGDEDARNPTQYWIGTSDVKMQAVFERNSELEFTPSTVLLPPEGGQETIIVSASKKWAIDPLTEPWAKVAPTSGDAGDSVIEIEIIQ